MITGKKRLDNSHVFPYSLTMRLDIQLKQWRGANTIGRGAITQAMAAEFLGVPYRTYQDWELGRSTPSGITLRAILEKIKRKPKPSKDIREIKL
jgi:DNA-binding transcriptional regulator YiaG